ncbi:GIY-YIG nuclease family protein [Flavobacterium sp.]|uniref:GIY-YIG nuclease family protein n=1 Tax=Flavobacterium sp. TaxID=239 RepID=UPI00344437CE
MFFVYILFLEKLNGYYVGITDEVQRRLSEHNTMVYQGSFTSKGIPWELRFSYECESSAQAYRLELFIKKMKSRKFIERLIEDKNIIKDMLVSYSS